MTDFLRTATYQKLVDLPDLCPNNAACNGWLVIIGNDQNRFVGCSSYTDAQNLKCKNCVKIAKLSGMCRACMEVITPKMLIAKHRTSSVYVHL
jgi:ssDNA-binding Zn-finger/Zn-ribbon topoisomerase 1